MKAAHAARYALVTLALIWPGAERTMARPLTYRLPVESAVLKKTPGNGYINTSAMCAACHSVDYISAQPRSKGRDFWSTEVNKMIKVYGAPIPERDKESIIDYLARSY